MIIMVVSIVAIRLQDTEGNWFNWDYGAWDNPPTSLVGGSFYVAFYILNATNAAVVTTLRLIDKETGDLLLPEKTETVPAGEGMGIEYADGILPHNNYDIIFQVLTGGIPLDTVWVTINDVKIQPNNWLLIGVIAAAAAVAGYLILRR